MISAVFLQDLYDQAINQDDWMFSGWYSAYERAVNRFRAAATSGVWNDDDISDLIRAKSNGIADYGQGALRENDRLSITKDWAQITPRLKDLCLASKEEIPKICDDIRNWLKSKTTRSYKVVFNRLFAALLPNVVSTAADESDFYGMIKSLRKKVDDYPDKQEDWVRDNIRFIDYCNEKVRFKTPWHSSIFAWYLKEYFDKGIEGEKKTMAEIERMKRILNLKKNIILQGAPGTGKTYNTAALALSVLGIEDIDYGDHEAVMKKYKDLLIEFDEDGYIKNDGQIGFVTFHQSMDYEDFVEGIKPKVLNDEKNNESSVVYDIEEGIFKRICLKANDIDEININVDDFFEDLMKNGKSVFGVKETNPFTVLCYTPETKKIRVKPENTEEKNLNIDILTEGIAYEIFTKKIETATEYAEKIQKSKTKRKSSNSTINDKTKYYFALHRKFFEYIEREKIDLTSLSSHAVLNYVLIIDEINRGNVSKIFGELISLLEADKRSGGDHPLSVILPYTKKPFSVPSNLYIIGTMNTTDRSVGSIDYAVRRRFAFVTLEANEILVPDGAARNLFKAVKNFLNESKYDMDIEDLMVGHSYFMTKDAEVLKMKWRYEILPLLMEYHKDGIISKSPLKDQSDKEIADVKNDYLSFITAWKEKKAEVSKSE